jgi:hypothetical protein
MSESRSCAACIFSVKTDPQKNDKGVVDLSKPSTYQCRRYPPQFIMTPQASWVPHWPSMLADHWCGEFIVRTLGDA